MSAYRGYRVAGDARVEVINDDGTREPLPHVVRHSPDGFEWGYAGSGPSDLALSILEHAGVDTDFYQDFKQELVASMPHEEWQLAQNDVKVWAALRVAS